MSLQRETELSEDTHKLGNSPEVKGLPRLQVATHGAGTFSVNSLILRPDSGTKNVQVE